MKNKIIKCTITSILCIVTYLAFLVGLFRFINLMYPIEANYFIKYIVPFFIPSCIGNICYDILKRFSLLENIHAYKRDISNNKPASIIKLIISITVLVLSFVFDILILIGLNRCICLLSPIDLVTYIKIISPFVIGLIINECNKYIRIDMM